MSTRNHWKCGWIVLMLVLAVTVTGSLAAERDFNKADTVRIGVLGPFQLPVGIGILNPARMAAEEINAAGGILGKKIEIVPGDTEGKPEKGITAMKKLVLDDKVDALVGEYSSGVVLAIQPYLSNYHVPFITTGAASPELTNNVKKDYKKNRYFFRFMLNSPREEKGTFNFLKDLVNGQLGYKKFAIISENEKWTQDYAPPLKADLIQAGMDVVFFEMFDPEVKDFSPVMARAKSSGAQWIAHILSHSASIPFVKAWQDVKPAPLGGCDVASMDNKFWEMTGGKCLSEITLVFVTRAPLTDKTIPWWDRYVKKFDGLEPDYPTGFTYDTIYMLAEIIKQKKSLKSDDLIAGLENISYKGVMHSAIGFEKDSHELLEGRYIVPISQWQEGGKRVVIYPQKYKTGDYVKPAWWNQ